MSTQALFDSINKIAEESKEQLEEKVKNKGKGKRKFNNTKREYPTIQMKFGGNLIGGNFEFRIVADKSMKFHENMRVHTVTDISKKIVPKGRVTVVCKGEECLICKRQEKLHELGYSLAWKYRSYEWNKILIKTGEVNKGGLTANTEYLVYLDDKLFATIMDSLQSSIKYFPEDVKKSMNPEIKGPGFIATSAGKSLNLNFIPNLVIDEFNSKDVLKTDKIEDINAIGMFRNSFIPEARYDDAVKIMDSLVMMQVDTNNAKEGKVATKEAPKVAEDFKDTETKVSTEKSVETAKTEVAAKEESIVEDKSVEEKAEDTPWDDSVETTNEKSDDISKSESSSEHPSCFGVLEEFDPSSTKCIDDCPFSNECVLKAYS